MTCWGKAWGDTHVTGDGAAWSKDVQVSYQALRLVAVARDLRDTLLKPLIGVERGHESEGPRTHLINFISLSNKGQVLPCADFLGLESFRTVLPRVRSMDLKYQGHLGFWGCKFLHSTLDLLN